MNTHRCPIRSNRLLRWISISAVLAALGTGPVQADEIQPLDSIQAAAEAFVLAEIATVNGADVSAEAGRLDPRLRLRACEEPLQTFQAAGNRLRGNTSVGVRCSGPQPWSIYVPVRVRQEVEVAVLTRNLGRGATVDAESVTLQRLDTGQLGFGYFDRVEEVLGQTLRRAANAGTVLTPALVAIPPTVRRGEQVTLVAERNGIAIRASGRALADARTGDLVRVRNLSSERVVEGVVKGPGQVTIHAP